MSSARSSNGHLIIVSSVFHGSVENRCKQFDQDGTILCLVPATVLYALYKATKTFQCCDLKLVDLPALFGRGQLSAADIEGVFSSKRPGSVVRSVRQENAL